jgi:hypothetical protein
MRVQVIDNDGTPQDILKIGHTEAELQEYTNKITNKPDPMIVYAPARFAHMSTIIERFHYQVQNIETGEIVEMPT